MTNQQSIFELVPGMKEMTEKMELPVLDQSIVDQIDYYLRAVYCCYRKSSVVDFDAATVAMLCFKTMQFVYSRDQRLEDISSEEMQLAIRIKQSLLPLGVPFFVLCLDGRVLSKLMFCLYGHAYRTPAGDIRTEFLPKKDTHEVFLQEGEFSALLDKAFKTRDVVVEIFDSHLHCAANKIHHSELHGDDLDDGGLIEDVRRKHAMAKALRNFVHQKYQGKKSIYVIQTSFDPSNGYSYFGLGKTTNITYAKASGSGYMKNILDELTVRGDIIYSKQLAEECPEINDLFKRNYFELDYQKNYRQSTINFWRRMDIMSLVALPIIEAKLFKIFPRLFDNQFDDERKELKELSVLILASAFNGWLHTHQADFSPKTYPYSAHVESLVAVTVNEKGPFDRAEAFSVNPDYQEIDKAIALSRSIVVGNRKDGRMSPFERQAVEAIYEDPTKYFTNPVLVFLFERQEVTESTVNELRHIDWSDLADYPWYYASDEEFLHEYLNKKFPDIPAVVSASINILRHRAKKLFVPGSVANSALLSGKILLVACLADKNRKIIVPFPFIMNGY